MNANAALGGFQLSWASRTDVGKVRQINEDSMLTEPGLFIVADGMGGHAAGDVASRLTIESFTGCADRDGLIPLAELADVVEQANLTVIDHATVSGNDGMGSTIVGAAVVDNGGGAAIVVFHVGDSRCYVFDEAGVRQITRDHSQVQEMIDGGEITVAEAAVHPYRNVVTRAVGIEPSICADFVVLTPTRFRRLLLCSDGVSGEVTFDDIERLLAIGGSPDEIANEMMTLALAGRAADNATLIVVDVTAEPWVEEIDIDATGPRAKPADEWPPPVPLSDDTVRTDALTSATDSGRSIIGDVPNSGAAGADHLGERTR